MKGIKARNALSGFLTHVYKNVNKKTAECIFFNLFVQNRVPFVQHYGLLLEKILFIINKKEET